MLSTGQVTTAGSIASLCYIPAGPCMVVFSAASGNGGDALIAGPHVTGGTMTTSNAIPLPAGASWTIAGYQGSAGGQFQVTSSGTAVSVTVGFLISNAAGGTGI